MNVDAFITFNLRNLIATFLINIVIKNIPINNKQTSFKILTIKIILIQDLLKF